MKKILLPILISFYIITPAKAENIFSKTLNYCFPKSFHERLIERKYYDAINQGCEHVDVKNPYTGAVFGLLPGGGSFYTGELGLGIADLLTWPISPLWDSPLAWKRANRKNMEATILYCKINGTERF